MRDLLVSQLATSRPVQPDELLGKAITNSYTQCLYPRRNMKGYGSGLPYDPRAEVRFGVTL